MQGGNCEVQWLGGAEEHLNTLQNKTAELMRGLPVTFFGLTITTKDVLNSARSFETDLDVLLCRMAMGCDLATDQVRLVLLAYARSLVFGLLRLHERWESYDDLIVAAAHERQIAAAAKLSEGVTISPKQDDDGVTYYQAITRSNGRMLIAEGTSDLGAYLNMVELIEDRVLAVGSSQK